MTPVVLDDVSVVVPTFNGQRYILAALNSVLAQSAWPAEIIVVDDCSSDGTIQVVQEFARTSPIPTRIIELPANSGSPSCPMNRGIQTAHGPLIAVLDQDDVFLPEKIHDESHVLRTQPDVSVVCSLSAMMDSPDSPLQTEEVLDDFGGAALEGDQTPQVSGQVFLQLLLIHGCFPMGFPGFMFRKHDWEAKGGIDESLRIADHDFLCWLATRGNAVLIPSINYLRRIHDANLSGDRVGVGQDYVEVVRRYLSRRKLQQWREVHSVRDQLVGIHYKLRDAGRYRDAFNAARCVAAIWGWNTQLMSIVCKLPPHWLRARLFKVA